MFVGVADNLWFIQEPRGARFPYCHCLYFNDDIKLLIDTSCCAEDLKRLQAEKPDIIINTHFHEDHIRFNKFFSQAEVWSHSLDAPAIRSIEKFKQFYGFARFKAEKLGDNFVEEMDLKDCNVSRELKDGEIINTGKTTIRVVHTPGHTPGHCSFYLEEWGILFSSDIDLSSFGPWYGHLCSDIDDFIASIDKCIEINPRTIITSHKGIITDDIRERLVVYRDKIYSREEKILSALQQPQTLDELAAQKIYYGPQVKSTPFIDFQEKMAIYNHLKRLQKHGLIKNSEGIYYRE